MRALLSIEFRRILCRRLTRALAAAAVAGSIIAGIVVFTGSHKVDAQVLERAQAERRVAIERCTKNGFAPPLDRLPAIDREDFCGEALPPPRPTFELTQLRDILSGAGLKGTSLPLVVLGGMLGASLIGAEWPSRSIATLLAWEPRRVRVAVAKILATVVVVFVGAVLLQAVLALALLPAAVFRGTTAGTDATWLQGVVGIGTRVAAAASLAAVMGASIALLGRSTAAALGAGFVYALVEVFVRAFEDPTWQRWLLGENGGLFVMGQGSADRSVLGAGVFISAVTVGLLLVAVARFRTRDVQ